MKVRVTAKKPINIPSGHKLFKGTLSGVIYLKISELHLINLTPHPGYEGELFRRFDIGSIAVVTFYGTVEFTEE